MVSGLLRVIGIFLQTLLKSMCKKGQIGKALAATGGKGRELSADEMWNKDHLPHNLHHSSLMARRPWNSRGWRWWVTSSISNVIVGLQRGSQFHQGALLAITSWEQNNPALSKPAVLRASRQGEGTEQRPSTHSVSLLHISCECKNKEGFMRSSVPPGALHWRGAVITETNRNDLHIYGLYAKLWLTTPWAQQTAVSQLLLQHADSVVLYKRLVWRI